MNANPAANRPLEMERERLNELVAKGKKSRHTFLSPSIREVGLSANSRHRRMSRSFTYTMLYNISRKIGSISVENPGGEHHQDQENGWLCCVSHVFATCFVERVSI